MHRSTLALALAMAYPFSFHVAAQTAADTSLASLDTVTVTGTREKSLLLQTPASVGVISEQDIRITAPSHPNQILNQIPGVAAAVTNGEGHTMAIRQPFGTNPLYLYLEDGIPIRPTGFFNHNALYEVNLPQAGGIEVVKGPGSALYGSDAIAGTVNILSRAPSSKPGLSTNIEAGSFGWRRALVDGTIATGPDGALRASVNSTHTDGWRDGTAYDRLSANFRQDQDLGEGATLKTLLGTTTIDQKTGANSALTSANFNDNPTKNNFSPAYRKVQALRLSTEYAKDLGQSLVTVTPYFLNNVMDLNASFTLSSDPSIAKTNVTSYGLMAKYRQDFSGALKPRLIVGVDIDRSEGKRTEDGLTMTTQSGTSGANTNYTGYSIGNRIYDYDVVFKSLSPYVHGEISPSSALRLTGGLRFDSLGFDMSNNLAAATTTQGNRTYGQLGSAATTYTNWSPKLAASYALSANSSLYSSYNYGFRAPSESQLFRAGSVTTGASDAATRAQLALGLKPIKANQFEVGWRGASDGWNYDVALYQLVKNDDLVSQRDPVTNVSTSVNAGKTEHTGIEVALGKAFAPQWRIDTALSYAVHRYVDWVTSSGSYSGKEMESAPRVMASTRLSWTPSADTRVQLEWVKIGDYWLEATNAANFGQYSGYDLFNLRLSQKLNERVALFARVMNLTDQRYADSASVSSNTPVFSPGLPRAVYAGVDVNW